MHRIYRLLILLLLILPAGLLSAQDSGVYVDELLNRYMELETEILENIDSGTADISKIGSLIAAAEAENRRDIVSRARMLEFIAQSSIDEKAAITDEQNILDKLSRDEKNRINAGKTENLIRNITIADLWVAGASTVLFAASASGYEHFYSKYTETEYADQAAFYLFWWRVLETSAMVSGITALTTLLAGGILSAVN